MAKTRSDRVRQAAIAAASALEIKEVTPWLREVVADTSAFSTVRVEALKALDRLDDGDLGPVIDRAVTDTSSTVRSQALRMLAKRKPSQAAALLAKTLEAESLTERQEAFAILGELHDASADDLLLAWLDRLAAGKVAPEVQLDVLEAAALRESAAIKERLARYEASLPAADPLAAYRVALAGGDSRNGRRIFLEKEEVSCQRCHKVRGRGGEVGPDLTGIGSRQTREYLLESLVAPNQRIAEGFETLVIATRDGQIITGVLKKDDGAKLHLLTADAVPITVEKSTIEEQTRGASAMPTDLIKSLSKRDLRDLVEFLATMRDRRGMPPARPTP